MFNYEQPDEYMFVDFAKSETQDDGSVIVYGRPGHDVLDVDGQIADKEWLKKELPEWYKWGNIREMHQMKAVGTAQKLEWDENEDPWVTAKITDKDAAKKVRDGVYKGFSIGIKKPTLQRDRNAPKGRFVGGKILELSVVDRPSVPTCKFDIAKAASSNEWVDLQSGFVLEDTVKAGNIEDPTAGNSVDFDRLGNPIMQPGHVKSNAAEISVVTMDDRGCVVQMGPDQFLVPYTVQSDGSIEFGEPEPLPQQPKATEGPTHQTDANKAAKVAVEGGGNTSKAGLKPAQSLEAVREMVMAKLDPPDPVTGRRSWDVSIIATYPDYVIVERYNEGKYFRVPYSLSGGDVELGQSEQVEQTFTPVATKAAELTESDELRRQCIIDLGKAVWTTEYIDDLPDSSFAYISPGGTKEDRHLPYKDKDGKIDAAHVRDALARLNQTDIPSEAKDEAKQKLEDAAKEVGIDVDGKTTNKGAAIIDAAKAAMTETAHCPECKKRVKLGEKVKEEDGQGGKHVTYKGDCGHMVKKFEKGEKPDETKGADSNPPSGMGEGAGSETGNAKGEPPDNKSGEKQENDIIKRMQDVIDELEKNQAGSDNEGTENKALAQLKELVNAFVVHQQEEKVVGKSADTDTSKLIADAVKSALAELGVLPDVAKAGKAMRKERLDRLKETHGKLGDLIDELDDKEVEEPDAAKAAGDRANGGPTPVDKTQVYERIKEGLTEFGELSRLLVSAESSLVHDSGEPGNLGPTNKAVPPNTKPAGDTLDFTRGDGGNPPSNAGADTIKAGDIADAVKAGLADVSKTFGDQLNSVLQPLAERLATIEHMANKTTKAELFVAENPGVFGQAQVQKMAVADVQQKISEMSPKQQEAFIAQMISVAHQQQGARR